MTNTDVLDTPPPEPPSRPALQPVAYLRGAGASSQTWDAVEQALHNRGVATIGRQVGRNSPSARTSAWHLARGGVPVVLVDFSPTTKDGRPRQGSVGVVIARYRVTELTKPLSSLLRRVDRERLAGQRWLDIDVETELREPELPWADPDATEAFDAADVDADHVARLVLHVVR